MIDWEKQSDTGRHHLGMAIDADVLQGGMQYLVSVNGTQFLFMFFGRAMLKAGAICWNRVHVSSLSSLGGGAV